MIKINLLAEGKRSSTVRKAKPVLEGKDLGVWLAAAMLLASLLGTVIWWWMLSRTIAKKEVKIAEAQREVEVLAPVIKEVEDFKKKKAELERKIDVINNLKLNQSGPVRVMDSVSRALPELLWLDRMRMDATTIEVEGRAFNTNAVANFDENLDRVPEFEEPTLKGTEEQPGGIYRFTLNFKYSLAPKPTPESAEAAPVDGAPAPSGTTTPGAATPPPPPSAGAPAPSASATTG